MPQIASSTELAEHDDEAARVRSLAAASPFGAWLLRQRRGPCFRCLAKYAAKDRGFPAHGSPRDVTSRIGAGVWDEDTIPGSRMPLPNGGR